MNASHFKSNFNVTQKLLDSLVHLVHHSFDLEDDWNLPSLSSNLLHALLHPQSQWVICSLLLLLLSRFSHLWLCGTPEMAAHQTPPSLGFSRQERRSGLPFPSPMQESEKWKWSLSIMSNSSWPHGLQPTRLLCPWDFPGKSTGVGCHCLLRICSLTPL